MYFLVDNCGGLGTLVNLIKSILNVALIIIGVALVVLVIIDIAKAVIASEEKEVKGYQKAAIRRVIYFVVIFFVVTIISAIFNLVDPHTEENAISWAKCWDDPVCEKNPNSCGK